MVKELTYFLRELLGYLNNRIAWMKTEIMIEFILWFDRRMVERKVGHLKENFSAHECGVQEISG